MNGNTNILYLNFAFRFIAMLCEHRRKVISYHYFERIMKSDINEQKGLHFIWISEF